MKKVVLPAVFFFLLSSLKTFAQTDTLFWFAAPEVSSGYANFDIPIVFRITSYTQSATVTISQPAGGGMPSQTISLAANTTQSVDLSTWLGNIENKPANTVLGYGLKISSTAMISVYYEVVSSQCACNPEIFVLKGQNALGTDFYIPSQNYLDNNAGYSPLPYSSFDIVATQNNTTVTITPAKNIVGHTAGVPFNIVLDMGETYSATASGELASQHLMGSRVTSDKPIAITYKDDLLTGAPFGGCADLGGDEIVPTNLLGTEYIAVKGYLNAPGDQVYILATQNGTSVLVNGVNMATLNAGQTYSQSIGVAAIYIQTSAPAYVLQMSGFGCEVGLDILPPIVCTGSSSVSFTRSTNESLYTTLLVENGGQGNFLFNGASGVITAGMFTVVPGTAGQWYEAQVSFTVAQAPLGVASNISNTTNLFHLGLIHGGSNTGCRFGYFSNFAQVNVHASAFSNNVCMGQSIQLFADTIPQAVYSWSGPQGFTSSNRDPIINNAQPNQTGQYIVTATIFGCSSDQDTVNVQVHPNGFGSLSATICPGSSYTLPDGNSVSAPGTYLDTIPNTWGCDSIITTTLSVTNVVVNAGNDVAICSGDSIQLQATGGISYSWLPTTDLSNPGISNPFASPIITTVYTVTATDATGCTGTDQVTVTINSTSGSAGSDVQICNGDSIQLNASGGNSYAWSPAGSLSNPNIANPFASPNITTTYTVNIANANGCVFVDQVTVSINGAMNVQITPSDSICAGDAMQLNVSGGTGYVWTPAAGLSCVTCPDPIASPVVTTTYTVVVTGTCMDTVSTTVTVNDISLSVSADVTIPNGTSTQLNASGALMYIWKPASSLDMNNVYNPIASPSTTTTYTVFGTTAEGCVDSATVTVNVTSAGGLNIANAFTPNGDGINDVIKLMPIGDFKLLAFKIFNRWGEVVFETNDLSQGWDGSYRGAPQALGTYVYYVRAINQLNNQTLELKGNITLIR